MYRPFSRSFSRPFSQLIAVAFLTLAASLSHATTMLANCQVLAVEDGTLSLAAGQTITVTEAGAIVGSTIYKNATISEQTNGDSKAVRVLDRSVMIEIISNIRTGDGTLYVTPASGRTIEAAKLICQ